MYCNFGYNAVSTNIRFEHNPDKPFNMRYPALRCAFEGSYQWTGGVQLPYGVCNWHDSFRGCGLFNSPVIIPNGVLYTTNMFIGCMSFNQPVTIPGSVQDCYTMFLACDNFNAPVTLGNGIGSLEGLFYSSNNFNQPVIIPDSVTSCSLMFCMAKNFNSSVTFGNNVQNAVQMFSGNIFNYYDARHTPKFGMDITLPDAIINCKEMLAYHYDHIYSNTIVIGNNIQDCSRLFASADPTLWRGATIKFNAGVQFPGNYDLGSLYYSNLKFSPRSETLEEFKYEFLSPNNYHNGYAYIFLPQSLASAINGYIRGSSSVQENYPQVLDNECELGFYFGSVVYTHTIGSRYILHGEATKFVQDQRIFIY